MLPESPAPLNSIGLNFFQGSSYVDVVTIIVLVIHVYGRTKKDKSGNEGKEVKTIVEKELYCDLKRRFYI